MRPYEIIDHTADIGLRIYGRSLKELFLNAAEGLADLAFDKDKVRPHKKIKIECRAPDREELLVNYLRELLYQINGEEFLFSGVGIKDINQKALTAEITGEKYDKTCHELRKEVKAVTYHNLKIEDTKEGLTAEVIFDV